MIVRNAQLLLLVAGMAAISRAEAPARLAAATVGDRVAQRELLDAIADASLNGLVRAEPAMGPEFPSRPDSSGSPTLLMLCALGGAGLFQVGWSARSWKLGALPDWYAEHAPDQIGRTLRYLPGQAIETGYPWQFDALAETPSLRIPARSDIPCKPKTRFVVEVDAPRGPPVR